MNYKKQFYIDFGTYAHQIMCNGDGLSLQETVKILNKQQAIIEELKKENFGLYDGWDCLQEINSARKDEIYEKDRTIEEQQNIIEKQERQIIHLTEEVIAYKKLVDEECDC